MSQRAGSSVSRGFVHPGAPEGSFREDSYVLARRKFHFARIRMSWRAGSSILREFVCPGAPEVPFCENSYVPEDRGRFVDKNF